MVQDDLWQAGNVPRPGLGGTIAQDHGLPGEKSCWRPVHYSSRDLTRAEGNNGKLDGESLGVASIIMANKMYLYGTEFEAVTDHQPLCPLYNSTSRALPTRVVRHLSKLGGLNFKLVYEPGSTIPSEYASWHPPKAKSNGPEGGARGGGGGGRGGRVNRNRMQSEMAEGDPEEGDYAREVQEMFC